MTATTDAKDVEWQERVEPLLAALREMQDKAGVFLAAMSPSHGGLEQRIVLNQLVEGFGRALDLAEGALLQFEVKDA